MKELQEILKAHTRHIDKHAEIILTIGEWMEKVNNELEELRAFKKKFD